MVEHVLTQELYTQIALHLLAAKYFQIAAFTMFLYDHVLTFDIEVEKIWKKRMSLGSALFIVNRYGTIAQYGGIINAFHDPSWTKEELPAWQWLEYASVSAPLLDQSQSGSYVYPDIAVVMILRVYALYGANKAILAFLMSLWTGQLVMSAIGLSTGFAIPFPPGLVGCIYTGTHKLFPCLWIAPLITDSTIFFLTIWRGRRYMTKFSGSPTSHIFVRDGALYFLVIFLSNLANTLIFFVTQTEDLKPIAASFNQLLTATMISRLVLNLRSVASEDYHLASNKRNTAPALSRDIQFRSGAATISTYGEATNWTRDDTGIMLQDLDSKKPPTSQKLGV